MEEELEDGNNGANRRKEGAVDINDTKPIPSFFFFFSSSHWISVLLEFESYGEGREKGGQSVWVTRRGEGGR